MTDKKRNKTASDSWTLLVVGELGNIFSFRLSKSVVMATLGGVASMLVLAVMGGLFYVDMRSENATLRSDLHQAQKELLAARDAQEGAEVRLMFLADNKAEAPEKAHSKKKKKTVTKKKKSEEKPASGKDQPKKRVEKTALAKNEKGSETKKKALFTTSEAAVESPTKPPTSTEPVPAVKKEDKPADTASTVVAKKPQSDGGSMLASLSPESLLVENLEVRQQASDDSVRFQFSLKNVATSGEKISGYTFVVLKPKEGSTEPARGSPWAPLKDGQPTIFKRGQYFSIARFKYVRGKFPQIQDVKRFETATVYVYTETGQLLLEKVFSIEKTLRTT